MPSLGFLMFFSYVFRPCELTLRCFCIFVHRLGRPKRFFPELLARGLGGLVGRRHGRRPVERDQGSLLKQTPRRAFALQVEHRVSLALARRRDDVARRWRQG